MRQNCQLYLNKLIILIGIFTLSVSANSTNSTSFSEQIKSIESNIQMTPMQAVTQLSLIIEQAQKTGNELAALKAQILLLEKQVVIDDFLPAQEAWPKAYKIASEIGDLEDLIRLEFVALTFTHPYAGIDTVEQRLLILEEKAPLLKQDNMRAQLFFQLGDTKHANYNPAKAITYLEKAYSYAGSTNDDVLLSSIFNSLGTLYQQTGDFDKALEYFEKTKEKTILLGNEFGQSVVWYNIGLLHIEQENFAKVEEVMNEALAISIRIDDKIGIAYVRLRLAEVAINKEEYTDALSLLNAATEVFSQTNDQLSLFTINRNNAMVHLGLGEPLKAIEYLDIASVLLPNVNLSNAEQRLYNAYSDAYFANKDYLNAYLYLQKYVEALKKVTEAEQDKAVQQFKIQFDTQLKENQNQILIQENKDSLFKIAQQEKMKMLWLSLVIVSGVVIVIIIIFLYQQIQHRNKFKDMALNDPLTNSPNRRAVLLNAERRLKALRTTNSSFTICIIDLDNFKKLNDQFGHDVGDNVLIAFAKACSDSIRNTDTFGRYGGEEWLVLLDTTDKEMILAIFERIKENINSQHVQGLKEEHQVTFSMGCAIVDNEHNNDLKLAIKNADNALYLAKEKGRDCCIFSNT